MIDSGSSASSGKDIHMIDRLIDRILEMDNPSVVGLDPTLAMMPESLKAAYFGEYGRSADTVARIFTEFNKQIIDAVSDIVPAVKPQIAMYEKFGESGIRAYNETCRYAAERGMVVIGDIKRGDISSTAAAYAAHLGGADLETESEVTWWEDAVTVNPYLGVDGIRPFTEICDTQDRGIFVLVRTSNPGSREIQMLDLADGRKVYEAIGELVSNWGKELCGKHGYSKVGAVVGATHREEGERLRAQMPHTFFLVPGYGAQGGTAEDVAGFFDDRGLGAIISSSRGITAAYQKKEGFGEENYAEAAAAAAVEMRDALRKAIGRR